MCVSKWFGCSGISRAIVRGVAIWCCMLMCCICFLCNLMLKWRFRCFVMWCGFCWIFVVVNFSLILARCEWRFRRSFVWCIRTTRRCLLMCVGCFCILVMVWMIRFRLLLRLECVDVLWSFWWVIIWVCWFWRFERLVISWSATIIRFKLLLIVMFWRCCLDYWWEIIRRVLKRKCVGWFWILLLVIRIKFKVLLTSKWCRRWSSCSLTSNLILRRRWFGWFLMLWVVVCINRLSILLVKGVLSCCVILLIVVMCVSLSSRSRGWRIF